MFTQKNHTKFQPRVLRHRGIVTPPVVTSEDGDTSGNESDGVAPQLLLRV